MAGRDLFALTQKLFATAADIDDMLGETAGLTGGMLRLGSDSPFYAAKMVDMFRRRHPQTDVHVRIGNARDVMRWLGEAQIDAAQASDPPGDATFCYEPLFTSGLSCALPVGHRLCAMETVPVEELAKETMILREPGSKTRAFTERALTDAGVEPASVIELQSRETIREGIALGLGVSAFFTSECPPDVRIAYRRLDTAGREYFLRGYLVCQGERRRSPLMRALQAIAADIRATSTYQ